MLNVRKWLLISAGAMLAGQTSGAAPSAEAPPSYPALNYDMTSRAPRIPPSEKDLQTAIAEPWFTITDKTAVPGGIDKKVFIEGGVFDRQGNLLFAELYSGRVMRLSPDRDLTVILPKNPSGPAGLGVHKDGRIFVAAVGDLSQGGSVFTIRSDGSNKQVIVDPRGGYIPDDIALDSHGGFYFTDVRGNNADPSGGVFYVAPDMKTITRIMTHMSMPNGIALSADGKTLWVGETGRSLLHRIELSAPTQIAPFGTTVPYHFTGGRPDGVRLDADGNVYVALIEEGRIIVFDPKGIPIGQILMPERDRGEFLYTSSLAIKPGTRELYILSNDYYSGHKAAIYRVGAFTNGTNFLAP
ncbi:SMP-30/gluconolactonase/LRE family protein [Rhizorhabdus argentea]|uniref:SMP-30/gluconolactonase/LRE family protein n=1 Tax=Rhizorhabdus argentea TaxID=1387174 RepID=UPI0030EEE9E1